MSHRIPSSLAPREKVPGPPVGWRPKALTLAQKLQVIVNQSGREPDGTRLEPMLFGVHFDHSPAVQRRTWDPKKQDTIPPSGDLNYIVARNKTAHAIKTAKYDVPEIAKTRRLEGAAAKRALKKERNRWPKRKIPKQRIR